MRERRRGAIGLGPVFVYEWLTASRRWQGYALRAAFVGMLLAALVVVAVSKRAPASLTRKALADLGSQFYIAVIGTQLTLILLAAPAATAGAICLDRARGTLTHLMVTDLSDAEIILGKLGSRLIPVLGLIACALPLVSLLTLLGGVDPDAMLGGFLVMVGVALIGCSLALVFSLWAGKTHEALLGTYAVWALWLLGPSMVPHLSFALGVTLPMPPPTMSPIHLAFGPYAWPGSVVWSDYVTFLVGSVAVSAGLAGLAVWRLRPVCNRDRGRATSRVPSWGRVGRWASRLPGPSLDGNPVLWREWHRNRPSRGARLVMIVYLSLAGFFSILAIATGSSMLAPFVNAFQVSIGLLFLSVASATAMAEERARGSLDVLMSTPLPTRQIVLGKWVGAFRGAILLPVLPVLVIYAAGIRSDPERLVGAAVLWAYVFAYAAMLASLGLAIATWTSRLGRAVGLTVTIYVALTVGWMFLIMALTGPRPYAETLICASSFFGAGGPTAEAFNLGRQDYLAAAAAWAFLFGMAAVALLVATLRTFNRCLGRVETGLLWEWWPELERGARARAESLAVASPDGARP